MEWRRRLPKGGNARRRLLLLAGGAALGALFVTAALPAWQTTRENDGRLQASSRREADLAAWSAAGAWLGEAARRWEPVQTAEYARRFPSDQEREALFGELARVAREVGIAPLHLQEIIDTQLELEPPQEEEEEVDSDASTIAERFAADLSVLPGTDLTSFKVSVRFVTDYQRLAAFLGGLRDLERAVGVNRLDAAPVPAGIGVVLELEYYARIAD